jgi:NitT/TauT family transport system ATP-binding protein
MSIERTITAGFLPLTDSAILIMAQTLGFARDEGLHINLVRETSWANIRDRVSVGHFDVAHMLAPMPIAVNLGLAPLAVKLIAPMTFGLGGNGITMSTSVWSAMQAEGAPDGMDTRANGLALARVLKQRPARLRLAVVHQNSSHNYELRYWLAASGIMPERDVEIIVLPPPLLPDALAGGVIDGYCVGEPWNSLAVEAGAGRIVATKSSIWPESPDKVLGMRESWAEQSPDVVAALIKALHRAAIWCGDAANLPELAEVMAQPHHLDKTPGLVLRALSGDLLLGAGTSASIPDFFVPHRGAANLPRPGDAQWYYSQMVRWNCVGHSIQNAETAATTYRPDVYACALGAVGARPAAHPQGHFFDGQIFDPAALDSYIRSQSNSSD